MDGQERVAFGSLERLAEADEEERSALEAAAASGNVNVASQGAETLALAAGSLEEQAKHAEALTELQVRRQARAVAVSTDDATVKLQLRALGEPVCLFGEREGERRSRLRELLARFKLDEAEWQRAQIKLGKAASKTLKKRKRPEDGEEGPADDEGAPAEDGDEEEQARAKTFYTPASSQLVEARRAVATWSWERAKARLARQRALVADADALLNREDEALKATKRASAWRVCGSQVGDGRPMAACAWSARERTVATGSFSGCVSVWDSGTFERQLRLEGHEDRCVSLAFHPTEPDVLVSGSADAQAKVWRLPEDKNGHLAKSKAKASAMDVEGSSRGDEGNEDDGVPSVGPQGTLEGHAMRLSQVAWHPMGRHIASTSYDTTWRLWDAETTTELLLQEGHEEAVYAFAFHPDGSLCVSGDLLGVCRLWDVRSGKSIEALMGHAGPVLSADFAVDGYHLATGSGDNTARVWDLRARGQAAHVIPAHQALVKQVRFDPVSASFLATAGYDRSCRLWATRDARPLASLAAHEHLVMDLQLSRCGTRMLTASYDRTWKLWGGPES